MSLKKIAEMTSVSVSTVSRVLNNASPTCASVQTRDKIWEAAREIGYIPNEAARQLKKAGSPGSSLAGTASGTGTIRHVTIILARVASLDDDPFFAELFRSLEIELMKQNTLIDQVIYAEESLKETLSGSDGVIILGRCSEKLLAEITARNKSVVGIWRNTMNFNVDEVICDGERAAEMAMAHLLSLGHSRIAYIGDCSYESRYVGYCNTLIQNHISMNYHLIRQTNQTKEAAQAAFSELLEAKSSGRSDFTAVFCANDVTAIGVLEILKKEKKKIRESISVISIDDIEQSQTTRPYLTTIHIPREEMAHMAVMLLLDRMQGGHREAVRIVLPCRIIERESCYKVL
ncbi:MAG: LacI family transcriptional regulator [Clostridiales bacterium]|nr:LacI family transcriptional regulator [Clostridiales bacterium]